MKTIIVVLALVLTITLAAHTAAEPLFSDIPKDHWAYEAVKELSKKGIMIGLPDGTFEGESTLNRYHVAVTLARVLQDLPGMKDAVEPSDRKSLQALADEFTDDLALLGLRAAAVKEKLDGTRGDIGVIRGDDPEGDEYGQITVTGDARLRIDNFKFENDSIPQNSPKDDTFSFYQIGLNFSTVIGPDTSAFFRVVNDDLLGTEFDAVEDVTFGFDLAYIDVSDLFSFADLRAGRQFVKVGHSLVLDDKLDAIVVYKDIVGMKFTFIGADMAAYDADGDGALNVPKNGSNLKAVDMKYRFTDHTAEFYYIQNSFVGTPGIDTVTYGLVLDGRVLGTFDYMLEFSKYDPDVTSTLKGEAVMGGVEWELVENLGVEVMYLEGDEEWRPTSIHYNSRFKDIFGNMPQGLIFRSASLGAPVVETNAAGSINGIKDTFFKLTRAISGQTDGFLIFEQVEANDSSPTIPNAAGYKRMSLGFDNRFAPNTGFGLFFDTVEYDQNNAAPNAGGWNRVRMEMNVKF